MGADGENGRAVLMWHSRPRLGFIRDFYEKSRPMDNVILSEAKDLGNASSLQWHAAYLLSVDDTLSRRRIIVADWVLR